MRLSSRGLTLTEIEDILLAITVESRVHTRKTGKTRLHNEFRAQRSPSEEQELNAIFEART